MIHNYQIGDIVELNDDKHSKGTISSVSNKVLQYIISIEVRKCDNTLTQIQLTDTELDNIITNYTSKHDFYNIAIGHRVIVIAKKSIYKNAVGTVIDNLYKNGTIYYLVEFTKYVSAYWFHQKDVVYESTFKESSYCDVI